MNLTTPKDKSRAEILAEREFIINPLFADAIYRITNGELKVISRAAYAKGYAAGQADRWIPVSEDEALAIAHEWGAELAHVKEFMLWAAERINKHRRGPIVTHINIDPDASDETKTAIGDMVRAAYAYKPPTTNP